MADVTPLRKRKSDPPKFPEGFVVGAVAKLKSGGNLMCITELLTGSPAAAHLEWHSIDGAAQQASYPIAALRLATEEEIDEADEPVEFEPEAEA